MLKGAVFGIVAGIVGAAIWAAIGFFLNAEVGYVALGIGFLVGIAVAMGTDLHGSASGIIAAAIAVVAVLVGKYAVVFLLTQNVLGELSEIDITDDNLIHAVAGRIMEEESLPDVDGLQFMSEDTPPEEFYPPGIWQRATQQFAEMSPDDKAEMKRTAEAEFGETMKAIEGEIRQGAFKESFSFFDLLWFGLAAWTAFSVGSGGEDAKPAGGGEGDSYGEGNSMTT